MADGGGYGRFLDAETVQYERVFPQPLERVWRAITDPAEVREWAIPLDFDLRLGGAWRSSAAWSGVITAFEPQRLLRCGHGPGMLGGEAGYFQYELTPVEGRVRLVFTHHFPGVHGGLARDSDGVAGGWHEIFDRLDEHLDGAPIGAGLPRTALASVAEAWARSKVLEGEFNEATAGRYVLDLRREEAGSELNRYYRERLDPTRSRSAVHA